MTGVRAFGGYMVEPARARDVIAPAYDSLSPAERARFADAHPDNFLNVMRTRDDYTDGEIDTATILERNRSNLKRLIDSGCFRAFDAPTLFIYRLSQGEHVQTGLVAELPVAEIDAGAVLRHELTQADRETLLVEYQQSVGASSSPVALAYRADDAIRAMKEALVARLSPVLDIVSEDGVRQVLWPVTDAQDIERLCRTFARVPVTYLTDGHHRTAAASRYVAALKASGEAPARDGAWNHVLVALFAHDELNVLPFSRVVRDLGDIDEDTLLARLQSEFLVEPLEAGADRAPAPEAPGTFVMVLDERCFRLTVRDRARRSPGSPVAGLDVSILQERVLDRVLGIVDSRADPRLAYVSGTTGRDGVNELRSAGWRLAFYCHPASIEDIMAVADAGEVMPPKSTCFEPKVRSGLFLRLSGSA